jgi:hypothetical protein
MSFSPESAMPGHGAGGLTRRGTAGWPAAAVLFVCMLRTLAGPEPAPAQQFRQTQTDDYTRY